MKFSIVSITFLSTFFTISLSKFHTTRSHFKNSTKTLSSSLSTPTSINITSISSSACSKGRILGQYYPNWANQTPEAINLNGTDLVFYFVIPTVETGISTSTGEDLTKMQSFVQQVHSNGKKAIVTFGGWDGSVYFSNLVSTSSNRKSFVIALSNFTTTYNFDGIDIDWEQPGVQGAGSNIVSRLDSSNFLSFLKLLREKIGKDKIIHAAVSTSGFMGSDGKFISNLKPYADLLDYITIMAYDFYASSFSSSTGPNSPFNSCTSSGGSVKLAVSNWIDSGFPACKILLGIGTYSHVFKTSSNKLVKTFYKNSTSLAFQTLAPKSEQPTDPDTTFNQLISNGWLKEDGITGSGGFKRYFDHCTATPILFNSQSQLFLSYDDTESTKLKTEFAQKAGLAGVNLFDSTGANDRTYTAIRTALDLNRVE